MKKFFLLLLVVSCANAGERDLSLTWTAPNTREDGSALSAEEIDHYEVCIGFVVGNCDQRIDTTETTIVVPDAKPLDGGPVYATVRTWDTNGKASLKWSNVVKSSMNNPPARIDDLQEL